MSLKMSSNKYLDLENKGSFKWVRNTFFISVNSINGNFDRCLISPFCLTFCFFLASTFEMDHDKARARNYRTFHPQFFYFITFRLRHLIHSLAHRTLVAEVPL